VEELGAEILERVEAAAAVLRRGGIVVYPTDTLYALGARADDAAALERLRRAKLRQEGKPLPLLTLVLPALPGVAAAVTAGTGTVGIRVPASAVARALAARAGFPLVSTSANPAGGPAPSRVSELAPALRRQVDHVLDGGATPGGPPSTVVRLDGESVCVLREGAISLEAVARAAR